MSEVLRAPVAAWQRPRHRREPPGQGRLRRGLHRLEEALAGLVWRARASSAGAKGAEVEIGAGAGAGAGLAELCESAARSGLCGPADAPDAARAAAAMLRGQVATAQDPRIRRAALAAAAVALARRGRRVHLLFALPEQAQAFRDAAESFFEAEGLPAIAIPEAAKNDIRRGCYAAPVVSAGVLQVATDHLRDRSSGLDRRAGAGFLAQVMSEGAAAADAYLSRPLDVALVDAFADVAVEAAGRAVHLVDTVELVNEALVASEALALALRLRRTVDFVETGAGALVLSDEGRRRAERLALSFGPAWSVASWREQTLDAALTVLHAMSLHRDYAIQHGTAQMSDPRLADRLSRGSLVPVQSLVMAKEQGEDARGEIVAEMPLRRFLNGYRHLAGITAPVPGLARDLWQLYALTANAVAPETPAPRGRLEIRAHADDEARWKATAARAVDLLAGGGKLCLVAPFVTPSHEAVLANLPSGLRDVIRVATRPEEIEEILAQEDMPVLFSGAETARWREPKVQAVRNRVPGAVIELHASWDDAPIRAVRDRVGIAWRRRLGLDDAAVLARALRRADTLERRAARDYRAARMRWETAMEQAFGFTGETE